MHRRQWGEAAKTLEESAKTSVMSLDQAVRTLLCLGSCYEHLGAGDRRLDALRQAVAFAPSSAPAGAELGAALLDAGRTDEAVDQLRRTVAVAAASRRGVGVAGRAPCCCTIRRCRWTKRDWKEVDHALGQAGQTPRADRTARGGVPKRGTSRHRRRPYWNKRGRNIRISPAYGPPWPSTPRTRRRGQGGGHSGRCPTQS